MIGKKIYYYFIIIVNIMLIMAHNAFANAGQIMVQVNATQVAVGDSLQLSIDLINIDSDNFTPQMPTNFEIESQSSQTSISMGFGQGNQSTFKQIFLLRAVQAGKAVIGPFTMSNGKNKITSNAVEVMVTAGSALAPNASGSNKNSSPQPNAPNENSKLIFLQANISNPNPWQGQRFDLSLKLFFRSKVANLKLPEINSNVLQTFDLGEQAISQYQSNNNGILYQVVEIKYVLLARKAGTQILGPLQMSLDASMPAQKRGRDPFGNADSFFDDFFSRDTYKRISVQAEKLELNVKPLPEPKPANWANIVGDISVSHDFSKKILQTGESATLSVTVSGDADLSEFLLPIANNIDGFKIYPDKPAFERTITASKQFKDSKTFKVGIVATKAGNLEFPEIAFSYFSPVEQKYVAVVIPKTIFEVSGTSEQLINNTLNNATTQQDITLQGSDILPIKDNINLLISNQKVTLFTVLLWHVPTLLGLLLMFFMFIKQKLGMQSETAQFKAFKAYKLWQLEIKNINKKMSVEASISPEILKQQASLLFKALRVYIISRGKFVDASYTPPELLFNLKAANIKAELIMELENILTRLEMYELGAMQVSHPLLINIIKQCETCISKLEKEWK